MTTPDRPAVREGFTPALRETVRPSIAKKVGVLLILMFGGAVGALAGFVYYLDLTRTDVTFVEVAGRIGLGAHRIGIHAAMSRIGREEDRLVLAAAVRSLEADLRTLWRGGPVRGGQMKPAPVVLHPSLHTLEQSWAAIRPQLRLSREHPIGGVADLEVALEGQLATLGEAVGAVQRDHALLSERRRAYALAWFVGTAALELVLVLVGLWLTSRFISRPVRLLLEAVDHLRRGGSPAPVPVVTHDELADVAVAFNELLEERAAAAPPAPPR